MTGLEHFIRVILNQHHEPVSRREYLNLLCDNAALTSAVEQKERARVVAVAQCRELQRALDDARRMIDAQAAEIVRLEDLALCQAQAAARLVAPGLSVGMVRWMVRND